MMAVLIVSAARACRWMPTLACALLAATLALPAAAQECRGSYAATLLHPIAVPTVITLDVHDDSDTNKMLAARFLQGMRDGGAKLDGRPNAQLSLSYSILGLERDRPGGGEGPGFADFSGFSGGSIPSVPAQSAMRLRSPVHPHGNLTLTLRAELSAVGSTRIDWVASVQCTMSDLDPPWLAYDMGRLLGRAAGHTVARAAF
jgi:hypothetical protein